MNEEEAARVASAVARSVRAICPDWLDQEVDDLAQSAAVRILEKTARDPDGELNATYLWQTAHSVVVDCIRRRGRRPSVALESDAAAPGASDPPEQEARLRGSRVRRALRDCLEEILPPRRRAVTLHLLGHSVGEVASLCGWPSKRADNLVYRGLADLRGCLRAKGLGDEL